VDGGEVSPRILFGLYRSGRRSSPAPDPADGPPPLLGSWFRDPPADGGEWTLGHRARQLYLDPATLAGDLARIGLPVHADRLATILSGDEPAPPVVLAGLIDVLELRDPAVGDHPLITAVARSWRWAGWPVPAEVLTVLATARNLSVPEVRALIARDPGPGDPARVGDVRFPDRL
jgi:hypothetical protein